MKQKLQFEFQSSNHTCETNCGLNAHTQSNMCTSIRTHRARLVIQLLLEQRMMKRDREGIDRRQHRPSPFPALWYSHVVKLVILSSAIFGDSENDCRSMQTLSRARSLWNRHQSIDHCGKVSSYFAIVIKRNRKAFNVLYLSNVAHKLTRLDLSCQQVSRGQSRAQIV